MASYEKRGKNSFRLVTSAGTDYEGKRIKLYKKVELDERLRSLTEKQLEKELSKLAMLFEEDIKSGQYLDGGKLTLSQLVEIWRKDYALQNLEPKTLAGYELYLRRILKHLGHIKLNVLKPSHITAFYNKLSSADMRLDHKYVLKDIYITLVSQYKKEIVDNADISYRTVNSILRGNTTTFEITKRISYCTNITIEKLFDKSGNTSGLDPKTIMHHHRLLTSILNKAVKWQLTNNNPAIHAEIPKVKKKEASFYTIEQTARLFELLEDEPLKYQAAIYIAIYGGLRLGEVTGLEWKDINCSENTLLISKTRQYLSGLGTYDKTPKTESSNRKISLSQDVIDLLKKYKAEQDLEKENLGDLWVESGKIFTQLDGKPMFPQTPSKWFAKWLKHSNLPKITFHQLRHTHASLLLDQGFDIISISKRLGHSSTRLLLNTYGHSTNKKDMEMAELLQQKLTVQNKNLAHSSFKDK